jgi:hypothetical protein
MSRFIDHALLALSDDAQGQALFAIASNDNVMRIIPYAQMVRVNPYRDIRFSPVMRL